MNSWSIIALTVLVIAGLSVIGGLWALMKQQVVVDDKGNVSAIEIPFFGKLTTNYPSLVAIFLGVALSAFVFNKVTITVDSVPLNANLRVNAGINGQHLIVGAIPTGYMKVRTIDLGSDSTFQIDVDGASEYNIVAFTLKSIEDGTPVYTLAQGPAPRALDTGGFLFEGDLGDKLQ